MLVVTVAWRNLWRRSRRTILTVLTVSLGLALLLVSLGIGDGLHIQMIEAAVRMGSGHVIVQTKGYQETGELDLYLDEDQVSRVDSWIEGSAEELSIKTSVQRVFSSGLASSADGSAGVRIIGVEPDLEAEVSLFAEKVVSGQFLEVGDTTVAILGKGVANKLRLDPGDKLVLMSQGARSKDIESILVRVRGIIETGLEELDQGLVLVPLETAQHFLKLGNGVHQVAIMIEHERDSGLVAEQGRAAVTGLEVLAWADALPELRDAILVDDGGNYVFQFFIFLLIAFTVMNTLLMSVLERSREFSLLDALGLTPYERFVMVLVEATFISVLSIIVGFGIGFCGHLYFKEYGLALESFYSGDMTAAGVIIDPVMYSDLSLGRVAGSLVLVFAMTLGLALLPAFRAAQAGDVHLLGKH